MGSFGRAMVLVGGLVVTLSAQAFAEPNARSGQELAGSWRITVALPPGEPGCPPGCSFFAMATATRDGTVMETAVLPGVTTGHGVWRRTGPRRFLVRSTYFRLGIGGVPIGTAETLSDIELDATGNQASGTYQNTLLDLNGTFVGSFSATVQGSRIVP